MTFIVRAAIDEQGRLQGVILDVPMGRKERFAGVAQLGELITAMALERAGAEFGLARLEGGEPRRNDGDGEIT